MRKKLLPIVILFILCITPMFMFAQTYDSLWKKVEEARNKSLPATMVDITTQIFNKAKAEKNSPQMLKAYTERATVQRMLTPDSLYANLQDMEQWAKTTDNLTDRAILHSLLAEQYADFVQQNRWQLRQRTTVMDEPSADVREWSGNMFADKVISEVRQSLADPALLMEVKTTSYDPFVLKGETSAYYYHDMFHLISSRAVSALKAIDFLDNDSIIYKEIETVYNSMLRAYREKGNNNALLLASLDYLRWQKPNDDADYLKTLDELITANASSELAVEVYLAKASYLFVKSEYLSAMKTADEAIACYPRYKRINTIKNIRQQILAPTLTVTADRVVYPGEETEVTVKHRNLDSFSVQYWAINLPVLSPQWQKRLDNDFLQKYGKLQTTQKFVLQRTADYQYSDTTFKLKAPAEGLYIMRVIPDVKVTDNSSYSFASTRLKILTHRLPYNQLEIVVLDALTGHPVEGAIVRMYDNKKGDLVEVNRLTTPADGKLNIPMNDTYRQIAVSKGTDKGTFPQYLRNGYYAFSDVEGKTTTVTLLTDRALYRPGQTVYVKGIAYQQQQNDAKVIPSGKYTLTLTDSNNREIGKKEVVTNEFGSFTAEFMLPTGGLNGTYFLNTQDGNTTIRVEEYKRPTFDITFDKQEATYRLGDKVDVKGTVKTFSGVPMQEPVQYTVYRTVRGWWGRFFGERTLIASGSVEARSDGQFTIPVTLQSDDKMKTDEGFYMYSVEASVTSMAGETQSSTTTLAAGTRSLILSANVPERINKDDSIKITFAANNLSGNPVSVEGEYKLYPYSDYSKRIAQKQPVLTGKFKSNIETNLPEWRNLSSGPYKLVLTANDPQGREATFEAETVLFSISDTSPAAESSIWYYPINLTFNKDQSASFIFGTSEKDAYILMDVFAGDKRLESKVLRFSDHVMRFDYNYKEIYGDGLSITFAFVKRGELYQQEVQLKKRLPERDLKLTWSVFRDKLRPGQQEEWKLTVKTPQDASANAEMLAMMYDASLDKIWSREQSLRVYPRLFLPSTNWMTYYPGSNNFNVWFQWNYLKYPSLQYDVFRTSSWDVLQLVSDDVAIETNEGWGQTGVVGKMMIRGTSSRAVMKEEVAYDMVESVELNYVPVAPEEAATGGSAETPDLRTNFAETAFFYPQLRTNENGEVVFSFTMPESFTRWNFRGYAHTKEMFTGTLAAEVVTAKEFMLVPNLPRFVRVGDQTSVAATVTNMTGNSLSGTVTFTLFDPITDKVVATQKKNFSADAGKSTAVSFMFIATDKYEMLGCRMVAEGGTFSDGEQHLLPVLSNKENIVETIAMPIRGNETREFSLESLFNSNSSTATNRSLTVEFSANPAWYAIQALPSLSLPVNDNAISWATVYYANTLASYIANSQPRIKAIFDAWIQQGGTKETFMSNLQKNQDVKNILLEESPWLMEAKTETEQMQRIATLFDLNNIRNNNLTALTKLKDLQLNNGAWVWYKGMSGSTYITNFVVEMMSRLSNLTGAALDGDALAMRQSAFRFLHQQALEEYNSIKRNEARGNKVKGISGSALQYLYLVAISNENVPSANRTAYNYFMGKINESITSLSLTQKANAAVVLFKAGKTADANAFIASLKEYATQTDEQGLHFAFNESPYSWAGLRVPAHVSVMEALDVVAGDQAAVEEMKLWLLKQKQTQQWDSPVSTVNAIYALMNRGSNPLENQGDVRITLGKQVIETLSPQSSAIPGTGYVKKTFTDNNTVKTKKVKVEKRDAGIAWGAVYAQYQEDIDKVNQYGGELSVDKKLYVERIVNNTKQLLPVNSDTQLAVGDKVVARLTIRLDRAMDFIQLKDQRGACFEPIGNLSGYMYNGGIGYYVAVKDASTNFFFDSLGKGVYVLEYGYRISRAGTYEGGLAVIQSAYAPEYASHSGSMKLKVEN